MVETHVIKLSIDNDKEKLERRKTEVIPLTQEALNTVTTSFSTENMQATRQLDDIFKWLETNFQQEIYIQDFYIQ